MDSYGNLSRETLIHEIKKLNKTIEALKFNQEMMDSKSYDLLNNQGHAAVQISHDYDILWANQKAIDMFDTLYKQKCYKALYGFEDVCQNCELKEVIAQKKMTDLQVDDVWHKSWRLYMTALSQNGQTASILESFQPLSLERDKIQEEKNRLDEVIKENLALKAEMGNQKAFLTTLSSSLLTPIKALRGISNTFDKSYLTEIQETYLEVLHKNSELLYSIFRNMLLNASKNTYKPSAHKREFNLNAVLTTLVDLTKNQFATTIDVDNKIPKLVIGDENQFTLALYMLVDAMQRMIALNRMYIQMSTISETGKKINIKLTLSNMPSSTGLEFRVFESIIKTEVSDLSVIDRFINETSFEVGKKAIESLGGTLLTSTTEGNNTHMTIFMSFDKVIPQFVGKEISDSPNKINILFVDNDKPMISLELMQEHNIYFAKSVEEAEEIFTKYDPQITIINIMLEGEDGFYTFDILSRHRSDQQYFVAVSEKLIENEREFMMDYGFDAYYEKPLHRNRINEIIKLFVR